MQCPANTFGQFLYVQLPGSDRILHLMDVLSVMGDTEADASPCYSCMNEMGYNSHTYYRYRAVG